jgi:hypothetical protein
MAGRVPTDRLSTALLVQLGSITSASINHAPKKMKPAQSQRLS